MSVRPEYAAILAQVRDAYRAVQQGAMKRPVWKREGAYSYTVQPDGGIDRPWVQRTSRRSSG